MCSLENHQCALSGAGTAGRAPQAPSPTGTFLLAVDMSHPICSLPKGFRSSCLAHTKFLLLAHFLPFLVHFRPATISYRSPPPLSLYISVLHRATELSTICGTLSLSWLLRQSCMPHPSLSLKA
jgi:hypothetical protein